MARGYIYHIATDIDSAASDAISAEDFNDDLHSLAIESTRDIVNDNFAPALNCALERFRDYLIAHHIPTTDPPDEQCENIAFVIRTGRESPLTTAKKGYFRARWNLLKNKISITSLEDFACDTQTATDIKALVQDSYGDVVMLDTGRGPTMQTLDTFIRTLKPDTAYYVSRCAVIMR